MKIILDDNIPGTTYFKWREALWLPSWDICTFPSEDQYKMILKFVEKVHKVRVILDCPMRVTSWLRPNLYNELIKGADQSWHKKGGAIDFVTRKLPVPEIKYILEPKLEELGLRMEKDNRNRVHLDNKAPGFTGRFFVP